MLRLKKRLTEVERSFRDCYLHAAVGTFGNFAENPRRPGQFRRIDLEGCRTGGQRQQRVGRAAKDQHHSGEAVMRHQFTGVHIDRILSRVIRIRL